MPGEDAIRKTELHIGSREAKALRRVAPDSKDASRVELTQHGIEHSATLPTEKTIG